jgi:hypothetical protein
MKEWRACSTPSAPVLLLVGALVGLPLAGVGAAATPAQKCAVAKNKAAAKKLGAKLKCHQKAIGVGGAVDPACLANAEAKFNAAIAKAEAGGGCVLNGDGSTIEAAVDFCVDTLVNLTPSSPPTTTTTIPPPVCCSGSYIQVGGAPGCSMGTAAACTPPEGIVQPGVCRSDGSCGAATPPGDCCDTGGACVVLVGGATADGCPHFSGTYFSSAICTATGCQ